MQYYVLDDYSDDRATGDVIGSSSTSGVTRQGVDVEGLMAIDHGALRIQPLVKPGWGRQGIAYGPYERKAGLALAVFLLNGHNTSQSGSILNTFRQRCVNWLAGIPTEGRFRWRALRRLGQWLGSRYRYKVIRKIRYWLNNAPARFEPPELNENLAIGWFSSDVPADPLQDGNAFIVHATGPENGELWVRSSDNPLSVLRGLQNVQTYYIIILREQGAAYYMASVPGAYGFVAYPTMRPVAIDPFNQSSVLYAALYQSVLGQIGFMVDTRVYGVQVELLPEIATWFGTAQAADRMMGEGRLGDRAADVGGTWTIYRGGFERTSQGARAIATNSLAVLDSEQPCGLIHSLVTFGADITPISLLWRAQDQHNYWCMTLSADQCQLQICTDHVVSTIAVDRNHTLESDRTYSLQVLDDGQEFSLFINGKLLFDTRFRDARFQQATGFGIHAIVAHSEVYFHHLEAHPRALLIPPELDLGAPWHRSGTTSVLHDDFSGKTGDLADRKTPLGDKVWRREMGHGVIEVMASNTAKVKARVQAPNPDRTAYTVEWDNPNFVDFQVEITPPGVERGQGEEGRAGLIVWQDDSNYIIINNWLNDGYGGAAVSSFFTIDGFEDLYDAVWSNVGDRILWGIPHQFRLVFDGIHYTVFVNDEPVLYRALTDVYPNAIPLAIRRIGIVANWEWGNDTGSLFKQFIAKI